MKKILLFCSGVVSLVCSKGVVCPRFEPPSKSKSVSTSAVAANDRLR